MRLRAIMIAIIVFSGLLLGMGNFFGSFTENYNASADTEFKTISKMGNISQKSQTLMNKTKNIGSSQFGLFGQVASAVLLIPNFFGYLFSIPTVAGTMLTEIVDSTVGGFVPDFVFPMVFGIVTVVLLLVGISAFIKYRL